MAVVLVVDDEIGLAELLGEILADEGHRVLVATNGKKALEQAQTERPDLVLTDFMMPIMDGGALLEALAADPVLAGVPVIMMSSMPEVAIAERCSGYAAFIRKPFNVAELVEVVGKFSHHATD